MNLPHWDLSNIFPSLESAEFEQGFANVVARVNALAALFDAQQVERTPNATTDAETVRAFDAVMDAYNATMDEA
ncbi:oligoendopeptidase F, partial [Anaerolineae bacterium CFX7]|nr:oligoendopeptidase F [Anaerolineae bacterium CFX7]